MLVAFGNPMLDIVVQVGDDLLQKHNLKPNGFSRISEAHYGLLDDIKDLKTEFKVGGTVTNTVRVFKWLVRSNSTVVYYGAIGSDIYGKIIRNKLEEEDIKCNFQEISHVESGKCYCLISGTQRSLVTDIGACKFYDMILEEKNFREATLMYVSALFRNVPLEKVKVAFDFFLRENKKIALNLGNEVVFNEGSKERMVFMYKNSDLVFGNEGEFKAFAKLLGSQHDSLEDSVFELNSKFHEKSDRINVITRGKDSVCVVQNKLFQQFPVTHIEQNKVVDTTGAGDALVGGFLSQYIQGKKLEDCVNCGIWAAIHIIQRIGCDFDKNLTY